MGLEEEKVLSVATRLKELSKDSGQDISLVHFRDTILTVRPRPYSTLT